MSCQHKDCQSEAVYHDERGWFCGWHWSLLPCNQVSESQKSRGYIDNDGAPQWTP